MERGWNPIVEISPPCPRCGSSHTKFCYYNNYSLTQPRYFCKGCRRYWTKGGSLRNVPIGGGCRKSRRGNKPFRHVNNVGIPSGGCVSGGSLENVISLGHVNGTTTNIPISSSSSSMNGCIVMGSRAVQEEGSSKNIDLALVYANFLNPKQEVDDHHQVAAAVESHHYHHQLEIPTILMPPNAAVSGGSSSFQMMDLMMTNQISQESNATTTFFDCKSLSDDRSSDGNAFYFSGLDSIDQKQQTATAYNQLMSSCTTSTSINQINNYMLPPLPGDEELSTFHSEGILGWSSCCSSYNQTLFPNNKLHGNESSSGLVESRAVKDHHPDDQLDENRSPFNVSVELSNIFSP